MADVITILTDDHTDDRTRKAGLPRFDVSAITPRVVQISRDQMAAQLQEFLLNIEPVLKVDLNKETGFTIDAIELSLAVNASGGLELIGKLNTGVQASIKLTLKRKA